MQTAPLLRLPSCSSLPSHPHSKLSSFSLHKIKCSSASSKVEVNSGKLLSARERRKMRNERREEAISSVSPWREVVKEKLSTMPREMPKKPTLKQLLDLDTLAEKGVCWWKLSVRKTSERSAAKTLFTEFRRRYPHAEVEIFVPEVPFLKKLKDGSYSKSTKINIPGYIFIKCLLNKEIHDFIRHSPSIRFFSATKVGHSKRWIMRPKPVSNFDMEIMLKWFEEEQEKKSQEIKDELAKAIGNKEKDSLVRQGHPEAPRQEDFSIGKNPNESLLKRLTKQRNFSSKKKYKLIVGSKLTSGRVNKFDVET